MPIRVSPPASNQDYGDNVSPPPQVTGGSGTSIQVADEGVTLGAAAVLNFVGATVSISFTASIAHVLISASGGGIATADEGVTLTTAATLMNFTGTGVTASGAATTTVNVPGAEAAGGQFNWGKYIAGRGSFPLG